MSRRSTTKSAASSRGASTWPGWGVYLLCYLAPALALLPRFREVINPDGVSYLSIAQKYATGQWRDAVNGYWGPLYSWLLAPLLALRLDGLLAARVLALALGLVAAAALWRLSRLLGLRGRVGALTLAGLLPTLWLLTYHAVTPDFLLICVLLLYLCALAESGERDRVRLAPVVGLLGALSYWAKVYGFYFFLCHFALVAAADFLLARGAARRRVAATAAVSLAVFVALSGVWVGALAWKYGRPMIGSAGAYNLALVSQGSRGHPMMYRGFMAPPNATATSQWEDPTLADPGSPQSEGGGEAARARAGRMVRNVRRALYFLAEHAAAPALIVVGLLPLMLRRRGQGGAWRPLWIVLAAALIYPLGYIPLVVEDRYLRLVPLLLTPAAVALLVKRVGDGRGWRAPEPWVLAMALLMTITPLRQLARQNSQEKGAQARVAAAALAPRLIGGKSLASNGEWDRSLILAYRLGFSYFGQRGDLPAVRVAPELHRLGVDYYFVWDGGPDDEAAMRFLEEVGGGSVPGLKVYAMAKVGTAAAPALAP